VAERQERGELRMGRDAREDIGHAAVEPPRHERADRHERDELHDGFRGDRRHEAGLLTREVEIARAEQDREQREGPGDQHHVEAERHRRIEENQP